jgi:hypothetical protein
LQQVNSPPGFGFTNFASLEFGVIKDALKKRQALIKTIGT